MDYPFPSTTGSGPDYSGGGGGGGSENRSMDVLSTIFFLLAALWLSVAFLYACLALAFLRLRARGELDAIYEPEFGRLYLLPCTDRFYVPLGCVLRRYVAHVQRRDLRSRGGGNGDDDDRNRRRQVQTRFMTRDERRAAMDTLLVKASTSSDCGGDHLEDGNRGSDQHQQQLQSPASASTDDGPTCSICLSAYEPHDAILSSNACPHMFHRYVYACCGDQRSISGIPANFYERFELYPST